MIKSTKNQLGNSKNYSQGDTKKVLCVCSAGLLRSATLQQLLITKYGFNVRNCGTHEEFALIPITEVLCYWADEIVFVNKENYNYVKKDLIELGFEKKCHVLKIPDIYNFNEPELVELIDKQYQEIVLNKK